MTIMCALTDVFFHHTKSKHDWRKLYKYYNFKFQPFNNTVALEQGQDY